MFKIRTFSEQPKFTKGSGKGPTRGISRRSQTEGGEGRLSHWFCRTRTKLKNVAHLLLKMARLLNISYLLWKHVKNIYLLVLILMHTPETITKFWGRDIFCKIFPLIRPNLYKGLIQAGKTITKEITTTHLLLSKVRGWLLGRQSQRESQRPIDFCQKWEDDCWEDNHKRNHNDPLTPVQSERMIAGKTITKGITSTHWLLSNVGGWLIGRQSQRESQRPIDSCPKWAHDCWEDNHKGNRNDPLTPVQSVRMIAGKTITKGITTTHRLLSKVSAWLLGRQSRRESQRPIDPCPKWEDDCWEDSHKGNSNDQLTPVYS